MKTLHLIVCCLLVMAHQYVPAQSHDLIATTPTNETTQDAQDGVKSEKPPLFVTLLESLKNDDSVLPAIPPDVHPIFTVYNREAIIPPQCYTRTDVSFNPCYVCHQNAITGRENVMNDRALQSAYSFSDVGLTNHWRNLFEDRSNEVSKISDTEILDYINQENYTELPERLRTVTFEGWIPDLQNLQLGALAFDNEGFAKDGSHWVAFTYKPFPSTFWPTNGSTDDVMIRLPTAFRTDANGYYSRNIYKANLAILEANIKGVDAMGCLPVDEQRVGIDLNGDGKLTVIHRITNVNSYVGAAHNLQKHWDAHLYPEDTEFLHTVRYLGITNGGEVTVSARMKEVRYMRKWVYYSKPVYARHYQLESFEKEAGNLPGYHYLSHHGLDNGNGWAISGFIEDAKGMLRVNTYEENLFCMGCHTSIGSTVDKTFSFPRKIDGADGWGYIDLKGMPDAPVKGETRGEIETYMERVGGGSEFRNNPEMRARWFTPDGTLDRQKVNGAKDVYELIVPSKTRALALNKAYKLIVEDQDFIFGRDASITPPQHVHQEIDNKSTPTLPPDQTYDYNIVLDWSGMPSLKKD